MKITSILFTIIFLSSVSFAQQVKTYHCNPSEESQIFGHRPGKVIAVGEDNKLTIRISPSKFYTGDEEEHDKPFNAIVTLAGIDLAVNSKLINSFLRRNVLNRKVTVIGNSKNARLDGITAVVRLKNEDIWGVNTYLIEHGIAKFDYYKYAYIVPMCTYYDLEEAEQKAKDAKLGIWAK